MMFDLKRFDCRLGVVFYALKSFIKGVFSLNRKKMCLCDKYESFQKFV